LPHAHVRFALLLCLTFAGCGRDEVYRRPGTGGGFGGGGFGGGGFGGGGIGGGGFGGGGFVGGGGGGGGGANGGGQGGGTSPNVPCVEPIVAPSLSALRSAMIGTWRGDMSTPWNVAGPVEFTFRQDNTYSARSLIMGRAALYYGTDNDGPAKKYLVTDIRTNGDGLGTIKVLFSANDTGNTGRIDAIRVCEGSKRLDFEFWPSWLGGIGPIEYRLSRIP
jgi:hypothetical protein